MKKLLECRADERQIALGLRKKMQRDRWSRMIMETRDLILEKAKYEDWEAMYRNAWSRPESAEYMLWKVLKKYMENNEDIM